MIVVLNPERVMLALVVPETEAGQLGEQDHWYNMGEGSASGSKDCSPERVILDPKATERVVPPTIFATKSLWATYLL